MNSLLREVIEVSVPLSDGVYKIVSLLGNKKVLEVEGEKAKLGPLSTCGKTTTSRISGGR